jgi:phage-related tail fiber protein
MWDHAQQSGMFTTEAARVGMEGGWTSGDGALTFRGPDGRGEFLRILDGGRGIDPSRVAGSWQVDDFKSHSHDTNVYPEKLSGGNYSTVRPSTGSGYLTSNTGGTETRPRNIAYPGRIKLI